jgi:hypothetical protein
VRVAENYPENIARQIEGTTDSHGENRVDHQYRDRGREKRGRVHGTHATQTLPRTPFE